MSRPKLLVTSGPTREYLDPVRYISNGSSGTMGACLARAGIEQGFDVTVISGPVSIEYPENAEVIEVVSTQEMFDAVMNVWPNCTGLIAAARPAIFVRQRSLNRRSKSPAKMTFCKLSSSPTLTSLPKPAAAKRLTNGRSVSR